MALLAMQDVGIAFGGPPVLDRASFAIDRGERVCLFGRNGAGKSTVMKLLDGTITPDAGGIVRQTGITVTRLEQEIPGDVDGTTYDVVAAGLGAAGMLLAQYHQAGHRVAVDPSDSALRELDRLHHALDSADAWQLQTRVETVLSHLGLDADLPFAAASGGRKRQTLLARALVRAAGRPAPRRAHQPPRCRRDRVDGRFLIDRGTTLVFVTHDRAFLRRLATRIVELDRGQLVDWGADYDTYLTRKASALAPRSASGRSSTRSWRRRKCGFGLASRRGERGMKGECARSSPCARTKRAAGADWRRPAAGAGGRTIGTAGRRGARRELRAWRAHRSFAISVRRSCAATALASSDRTDPARQRCSACCSASSHPIRERFGSERDSSSRISISCASSSTPSSRVFDSIADGADFVEIGGERKHVTGYLQDFLFPPDRARTPIKALSGGERNRLLLARLFTRSFNLLVLDEPTNDLDIETLDLLEELLLDFSGTLLLVSHDRAFLDNVVTSTLVLEGGGRVGEFVGGYTDWVRQRTPADTAAAPKRVATPRRSAEPERAPKKRKLTFAENAELAALPNRIEAAEQERVRLYASLADPALLRDGAAVVAARDRLSEVEAEVATLMSRWEALATIDEGA